ncbi:hypothetical protein E3N88_28636 [Mikania micrantha]|uniref:DUF4219 domain-containing protein n=1 Tax=Mikania micrantha TaxID=192012 RepID=A0A5N6N2V1_9ASTR|nr:hypothetical protein E3N88_28636 [Mikania micrantha]
MAALNKHDTENGTLNKPPMFTPEDFDTWKVRMEGFIRNQDFKLWKSVLEGPYIPTLRSGELTQLVKAHPPKVKALPVAPISPTPRTLSTDARGRINMGEAGIESFQEPVERKDLFPAFLSFQRESLVLGHKSFD